MDTVVGGNPSKLLGLTFEFLCGRAAARTPGNEATSAPSFVPRPTVWVRSVVNMSTHRLLVLMLVELVYTLEFKPVTKEVRLPNVRGHIGAYGDFNADKANDILVLSEDRSGENSLGTRVLNSNCIRETCYSSLNNS